jgi:predicted component of type VI protein secretion system
MCHPKHYKGGENIFQPIFGTLVSVSTSTEITSAELKIGPYNPSLDLLSLLGAAYHSGFIAQIANGVLTMTSFQSSTTAKDWQEGFKWLTYRLNVPVR